MISLPSSFLSGNRFGRFLVKPFPLSFLQGMALEVSWINHSLFHSLREWTLKILRISPLSFSILEKGFEAFY